MKKILNILLVAVLAFGLFSCEGKKPIYKPAQDVEGQGVFFAQGLPTSFNLDDSGIVEATISRTKSEDAASVSIQVTADPIFTVPSKASFAAGQTTAKLVFEYDPADVVFDQKYEFAVQITEQVTPWGVDNYSFTAVMANPVKWNPISTNAMFVETIYTGAGYGFPASTFDVYVEKMEGKNIFRIPNLMTTYKAPNGKTYTHPAYAAGGVTDDNRTTTDVVYTIFDMEGDLLPEGPYSLQPNDVFTPIQSVGLNLGYGEMHIASIPFNLSVGGSVVVPGDGSGYVLGKYDADKKCIDLGSTAVYEDKWYLMSKGNSMLYFDKTLMVEDYNDLKKYQPLAIGLGTLTSQMFEDEFEQEFNVGAKDETLYYLPEFFGGGFGLAFVSDPYSKLQDGAEILPAKNVQKTGMEIFGREVIANVKKGKVTMDGDLPTFELQVHLYSEATDNNPALDFGIFVETVAISEFYENYYPSDYSTETTKAEICGNYELIGTTIFEFFGSLIKMPQELNVTVLDLGAQDVDKDGEDEEVVAVLGLSPYGQSEGWNDAVGGVFENGVITFLYETLFPFTYDETESPVYLLPNFLGNTSLVIDDVYAGVIEENGKFAITMPTSYNEYLFFSLEHGLVIDEFQRTFGEKVPEVAGGNDASSDLINYVTINPELRKGKQVGGIFDRLQRSTVSSGSVKAKEFTGKPIELRYDLNRSADVVTLF